MKWQKKGYFISVDERYHPNGTTWKVLTRFAAHVLVWHSIILIIIRKLLKRQESSSLFQNLNDFNSYYVFLLEMCKVPTDVNQQQNLMIKNDNVLFSLSVSIGFYQCGVIGESSFLFLNIAYRWHCGVSSFMMLYIIKSKHDAWSIIVEHWRRI